MTRAQVRAPAPVRVVWDGQSQLLTPPGGRHIPALVMSGTGVPSEVVAISGTGWQRGTGEADPGLDATVAARLFPQARNRDGCSDVLVLCGGQHDAIWAVEDDEPNPGIVAYNALVAYAAAARSAGFGAVIATTMPAIAAAPVQAAFDEHNAELLDDEVTFDAVVDLSTGDLGDPGSDAFIADGIHLSAIGSQLAADFITPVLAPFLI